MSEHIIPPGLPLRSGTTSLRTEEVIDGSVLLEDESQIMIHLSVPGIGLLVGAAILLLGRKLFWLFVAAIGFALGAEVAPQIVHQPAPLATLAICCDACLRR